MTELIEVIKSALTTVVELPALVIFTLAMVVLAWAMRRTAWISNKLIPIVMIFLSGVVVPIILPSVPPKENTANLSHPELADWIRRFGVGMIVGLGAWGSTSIIFKTVSRFLPDLVEPPDDPPALHPLDPKRNNEPDPPTEP